MGPVYCSYPPRSSTIRANTSTTSSLKQFYNEILCGDWCTDFGADAFRDSRSTVCIWRVGTVTFTK